MHSTLINARPEHRSALFLDVELPVVWCWAGGTFLIARYITELSLLFKLSVSSHLYPELKKKVVCVNKPARTILCLI